MFFADVIFVTESQDSSISLGRNVHVVRRTLLFTSLFVGAVVACGGSVATGENPGVTPDGGGTLVGKDGGTSIGKKDAGARTDGGTNKKDAGPFVEPTCPNPPPPIKDLACDIVTQTGCPAGDGCYGYIEYPTGYCDPETYISFCAPAGTRVQGEICGGQEDFCAPGFSCVVSGAGTVCAKHCTFENGTPCPEGKVCEPTDFKDIGVCL